MCKLINLIKVPIFKYNKDDRMQGLKIIFITAAAIILLMCRPGTFARDRNESRLDTAKILIAEEKYGESLAVLDSILIDDSTNVGSLYCRSLCYRALSDYQKASRDLSKALIYKPDDLKLMISLGDNLSAAGRLSRAEEILSKAFSIDSVNRVVLISLGKVLMQKHEWIKAVKIYNRLIRTDSTNSFSYEQAGKCCILLEDTGNAVIDLQVAHRLNPFNERTILELSVLYYAKNQFVSAMHIVDDGLAVYPESAGIWTKKGDIYLGMKKYGDAVNCYGNSLRYGDSSDVNFRNCGLCYYFTGKYDSAVAFLSNATKLNKKDPTSFFYLGASFKELNDYNKAIENLFAALNLLKSDYISEVYTQLASSYYLIKNYEKSLEFYKDALKENPKKFELNFYLAAVYEHYYKDKSVAMNYYKKFLSDSSRADKKLVAYAKDRIDIITENNFMNNKK